MSEETREIRNAFIIGLLVWAGAFYVCASAHWTDCVCNIQGIRYGGSGTLIAVSPDGHGLVISAAHVFKGGNTHDLTCEFPAVKKKWPARLLSTEQENDIAALDIESAPDVDLPPAVVAGTRDDGPFICCGFPYDSRHKLRWTKGAFVGYDGDTLQTYQQVRSGFSGGGRFNRYGEYVGPISGTIGEDEQHMDKTWGASGEAMVEFVRKYVK